MDMRHQYAGQVRVLPASACYALQDLLPSSGTIAFARLDGSGMSNVDEVFTQFYEAFELPNYFGWNWPALSDCLTDLNWLPADRYAVVIENAHHSLAEDQEAKAELLRVLARAVRHWAGPGNFRRGRQVIFDVVMLCPVDRVASLESQIVQALR